MSTFFCFCFCFLSAFSLSYSSLSLCCLVISSLRSLIFLASSRASFTCSNLEISYFFSFKKDSFSAYVIVLSYCRLSSSFLRVSMRFIFSFSILFLTEDLPLELLESNELESSSEETATFCFTGSCVLEGGSGLLSSSDSSIALRFYYDKRYF